MGDWNINSKSSPKVVVHKWLYISIYNIDEYKTSCLNYETEERRQYLYVLNRDNIVHKINSVLVYKNEDNRI